jgi:transposase InsO family protein
MLELDLPDMPKSLRALQRHAADERWALNTAKSRKQSGRAGQMEYCTTLLPQAAQLALKIAKMPAAAKLEPSAFWSRFESLPESDKARARARLAALDQVETLVRTLDYNETSASARVSIETGFSIASLANWKALAKHVARQDRLAALAPSYKREADSAECHADAWDMLVSLWLRPSAPALSACFRLMLREAAKQGWEPIPSERALRRRIERDVPRTVQVLSRQGREAARQLIPAQRRSVKDLHAMQAVNMDGHKFDVFVKWPGHDTPIRPMMVMIQDLYSRKVVAWRLSDSENKDTVRLAIGDMVETYGIPEKLTLDNGRAFASKWISGGSKTRFRFKIRKEEPEGLVTALGIELHWATPGRGQSKPIERAFRDLAESISKHPACDGAYTGNRPDAKPENYASRAMDLDLFKALIGQEIIAHNARTGRRTEMANGRSFDEAFSESYANAVIRWPSEGQKSLWLMAAEKVRAKKGNGLIEFHGNRYYAPALSAVAGKNVTIRFDPDHLHEPLRVYDEQDQFLCEAPVFDDTGFYSHSDAHASARTESSLIKVTREQRRLIAKIDAAALGRIALNHRLDAPEPPRPRVKRLATGGARAALLRADQPVEERMPDPMGDTESRFAKGLRVISGGLEE